MFSAQISTGRLLEVRLREPFTLEDLRGFRDRMGQLTTGLKRKLVACSDTRALGVMPPEVADKLRGVMVVDNPAFERIGILLGRSAVVSLQLERTVREARNPMRCTFRERSALEQWLGMMLDDSERARMGRFLDEHETPQPASPSTGTHRTSAR